MIPPTILPLFKMLCVHLRFEEEKKTRSFSLQYNIKTRKMKKKGIKKSNQSNEIFINVAEGQRRDSCFHCCCRGMFSVQGNSLHAFYFFLLYCHVKSCRHHFDFLYFFSQLFNVPSWKSSMNRNWETSLPRIMSLDRSRVLLSQFF